MKIRAGQEAVWQEYQDNNPDGYGGAILRYAQKWADLMEEKLSDGVDPREVIPEVAQALSRTADEEGITGFMYGAAVKTLSDVWEHGEVLRRWHNGETQLGNEGDAANDKPGAVLNPVLLNIPL